MFDNHIIGKAETPIKNILTTLDGKLLCGDPGACITKGKTTIAIAHRLSTLSNADQLIVLDKGRLAEMGTHDELMRHKGVYYNLVMAQRQTTKMKKVEKAALA